MNKVAVVEFYGGVLSLFNSPRNRLNKVVELYNSGGYKVRQVIPGKFGMLFSIVSVLMLVMTMGLYQPLPGYIVIFEEVNL